MKRRIRAGATLWIASAVIFPIQFVTAMLWPSGYSFSQNAISDLGVTVCGEFSEQGNQIRDVCSPAHALFNSGMVLTGALLLIGSVLLYGYWPTMLGRIAVMCMAIASICVVAVGLLPWNTEPELHDLFAFGQALFQWAAMLLIAAVVGRGASRWLSVGALILSLVGFLLFILALDGIEVLSFGIAERIAFDVLTLWCVGIGLAIMLRPGAKKLTST